MMRALLRLMMAVIATTAVSVGAGAETIPQNVFDLLMAAGHWSTTADEDQKLSEKLPLSTAKTLVQSFRPGDTRTVGLLVLTTSAGKWGVETGPDLGPGTDPAKDKWSGPKPGRGKHLMSYKTGGVGLPHLDDTALSDFIRRLLEKHSDIGPLDEQIKMQNFARRLSLPRSAKGRVHFAHIRNDAIFRKWMLAGLRTEDGQRWILDYWLTKYWDPAFKAANNNIRVALVLSRVWNTGSALGRCAAKRAAKVSDGEKVHAVLEAYVTCPGGQQRYRKDRLDWMRRPVVLFDRFHVASPQ